MNNKEKLERLRAEIARIEEVLRETKKRIANETIGNSKTCATSINKSKSMKQTLLA